MLEALDLLGEDVKIYLNEKEKIKSSLGGCITTMMVLLTFTFAWLIGKDVVYKEKPFSYSQQTAHKHFFNNTINKTTFPLAFSLVDFNNDPLVNSSKYLSLELKFVNNNYSASGKLINSSKDYIDLVKCQKEDFPTLSEEEFINALLTNAFCPKMNSVSVYGFWSESNLGFLSIVVKLCDYDTYDSCPSKSEIISYVAKHSANLGIYVLEPQIVFSNYSEPIQKYVINPYKFLNDDYKIVNYMIEKDYVETDSGFFLESFVYQEFFRVKEVQTDTAFFDPINKILLQCDFYSSNMETTYKRRYIKIPEVLASTGGLFKLFMLIGYYLNFKFAKINKNLKAMSCMFKMEQDTTIKGDNKIIPTSIQGNFNKHSLGRSSIDTLVKHSGEESNKTNDQQMSGKCNLTSLINKLKSRNDANVELKCSDYYQIICNNQKKSNQTIFYTVAAKQITKYTDIIFIFRKLLEVDVMKNLYFSDTQKKILTMIKPILSEKQYNIKTSPKEDINSNLDILFSNLNENEINHKLLQFLIEYF